MFGTGWKQDVHDPRDVHSLVGFPWDGKYRDEVPASLRAYKRGYLYQNGFGACTAFALTRAIHMALLIDDEANGRVMSAAMPSPGFIYYNGRRQESVEMGGAGLPALPVRDGGAYPRLVMKAVQSVGFCREVDYPFASLADDITKFPDDNRKPPPRAYMAAFDQRNLRYSRVTATGSSELGSRRTEVQRLLKIKKPVIFGMTVDQAFMNNHGSLIESVDPAKAVGGHMLCALEATEDGLIFDNWWGDDWGTGGEGILSWELFGSDVVGDVYALDTAPSFSSEEP